ncbi:MAG: hypothetical protein FWG63_05110 [Defluviitaleaceae bacterium]|nr:hypothetical protein [Defluviitaleaceae bacterium]
MTAPEYWQHPDIIQARAMPMINRHTLAVQDQLDSITTSFPPNTGILSSYKVNRLHRQIDKWREAGFYSSNELAARASYLRRRRHIESNQAFELLLLAAFVEHYSNILNDTAPLYEAVAREKYHVFTGEEIDNTPYNPYSTILPNGSTMAVMVHVEASHRARRMSRTIHSYLAGGEDDEALFYDMTTREMNTARNQLLKKREKGGFSGIMERVMLFAIGYAVYEALKKKDSDGEAGYYVFHAVMDGATTENCLKLDGKRIPIKDAVLGVNLPPIVAPPHPCRSWVEVDNMRGRGIIERGKNVATHGNIQEKLKKGEYVDTVVTNKGNIIDITPTGKHSVTRDNLLKGEPNSSVDILDREGGFATRRWFNESGNQFKDVDFTDHSRPAKHPEHPHEHGRREGRKGSKK